MAKKQARRKRGAEAEGAQESEVGTLCKQARSGAPTKEPGGKGGAAVKKPAKRKRGAETEQAWEREVGKPCFFDKEDHQKLNTICHGCGDPTRALDPFKCYSCNLSCCTSAARTSTGTRIALQEWRTAACRSDRAQPARAPVAGRARRRGRGAARWWSGGRPPMSAAPAPTGSTRRRLLRAGAPSAPSSAYTAREASSGILSCS